MPIYWGDYARDTAHLSNTQHGSYLLLIKHYWCTGGPLPDNDEQLWRIACCAGKSEWKRLRPALEKFFVVGDGLWRHKRIDAELAEAQRRVETRRNAGSKGAGRNWRQRGNEDRNAHRNANGNAIDMPSLRGPHCATQPQPQSQKKENSRQTESTTTARAKGGGKDDPAVQVIAAFDDARARAFGGDARRPWPSSTDYLTAKDWLEAGLSVAELGAMFDFVHRKLAGQGHAPPETLRFHKNDVDRLLRAKSTNAVPGNAQIAEDAEEAGWRSRLKQFSKDGFWIESWGPKPGEPGSFVPREMLREATDEVLQ
jgi:uncharacterized protein YdaU (DUF1376 family)